MDIKYSMPISREFDSEQSAGSAGSLELGVF